MIYDGHTVKQTMDTSKIMKKTLLASLIVAFAAICGAAHAEDYYAGVSIANPGSAKLNIGANPTLENNNNPLPVKLYGGYNINSTFAVEAGYGAFGSYKFSDIYTPGQGPKVDSNVFYVAGKATKALDDKFDVYGKLGVARTHMGTSNLAGVADTNTNHVGLTAGIGADYKLTNNLSAVVEYNYYGKVSAMNGNLNLTQQKLEAGLKYSF